MEAVAASLGAVAAALRMAAQSLAHSKSALGSYYRSMRAKLGAPAAVTATAHKLARVIYSMLKKQEEYHAPDPKEYEAQYRQRAIKNLQRKAKKLGLKVVLIEA